MVGAVSGPGHNGGPSLEGGVAWRTHCWRSARAALLPVLPIEVIRTRVRRAAELGLDYKTYAGVRATTGRDIVAFLFSTNALGILRHGDTPTAQATERMAGILGAGQVIAVHAPFDPDRIAADLRAQGIAVTRAAAAPTLADGWGGTRARILSLLAPDRLPADGVLLVGETPLEREWAEAGRLAGFLPAARYFGTGAQGL
ncbi:MAG: hypothetical protein RLZZ528_2400 [Pseudomonadota bacterium]